MAAEQKDHQQRSMLQGATGRRKSRLRKPNRDLAQRERDEKRRGILLRMAEAEERHAQRWKQS